MYLTKRKNIIAARLQSPKRQKSTEQPAAHVYRLWQRRSQDAHTEEKEGTRVSTEKTGSVRDGGLAGRAGGELRGWRERVNGRWR